MKNILLLIFLFPNLVYSQRDHFEFISGTVTDVNGKPIQGVNARLIESTGKYNLTDEEGNFSIDVRGLRYSKTQDIRIAFYKNGFVSIAGGFRPNGIGVINDIQLEKGNIIYFKILDLISHEEIPDSLIIFCPLGSPKKVIGSLYQILIGNESSDSTFLQIKSQDKFYESNSYMISCNAMSNKYPIEIYIKPINGDNIFYSRIQQFYNEAFKYKLLVVQKANEKKILEQSRVLFQVHNQISEITGLSNSCEKQRKDFVNSTMDEMSNLLKDRIKLIMQAEDVKTLISNRELIIKKINFNDTLIDQYSNVGNLLKVIECYDNSIQLFTELFLIDMSLIDYQIKDKQSLYIITNDISNIINEEEELRKILESSDKFTTYQIEMLESSIKINYAKYKSITNYFMK